MIAEKQPEEARKQEVFYKVVRRNPEDGLLISANVSGMALVVYGFDFYSKAPIWLAMHGYGLCVFSSVVDAKKFNELNLLRGTVYPCKVRDVLELPEPLDRIGLKYGKAVRGGPLKRFWPSGTAMVRELMLMRSL